MIEAEITHVAQPTTRLLQLIFKGGAKTFELAAGDVFARNLMPLPEVCNDLMRIACAVFHADGSVSRGGDARSDLGDDWRRDFRARIKVSQPQVWGREDVSAALREAAEFLTEDSFQFDFDPLPQGKPAQEYFKFGEDGGTRSFDEVILFSGGLDSFAGALQALAGGNGNVVLLTHRSAQKAITRQTHLADYLKQRFPRRVLHVEITARRKSTVAVERTQRSRSLLFSSLAYGVARALGISTISFYENGIISQNLPIAGSVVGTMATRTTHPYGLLLLERLLATLGEKRITIRNPFAWKTKSEVLEVIRRYNAEDLIKHTVSCTSLHTQSTKITHCGACTQCLDRRFAVYATNLEAFDPGDSYQTDVFAGARTTERSREIAAKWTRHARSVAHVTRSELMSRFGLEVSRVMAGNPDLPSNEVLARIAALQSRHGNAALSAIARALAIHGPSMARGEVPKSALISSLSDDDTHVHPVEEKERTASKGDGAAVELPSLTPSFSFPLQVVFSQIAKGGSTFDRLEVVGLGAVQGLPASVAHGLKITFDKDQADGRSVDDCRYVLAKQIPMTKSMKPSAVTKNIQRCREELEEYYIAVEGDRPSEPILIQSHVPKGYRLDPTIRVVKSDADSSLKPAGG